MGAKVDLRVLELLASRICHDLISPIGAVGNGLELLEDADDEMSADALKLSMNCVRRASALLEFFRMAYGAAGSDSGLRWETAKGLAEGLIEGPKTTLVWAAPPAGLNVPAMAPKLGLNLTLLATEMLPRGGEIAVGLQGAGNRLVVSALATGRDARLPEEVAAAIAAPAEPPPPLTARTVHGFFAARLADAAGGRLEAAAQPSGVRLVVSIPMA